MVQHYRRTLLRGLGYALAMTLVPFLTGIAGLGVWIFTSVRTGTNPPPYTGAFPAPPRHDETKRTAVIIAANSGTEGSDFLAPFEVIGRSGAFNLYAVAPERRITHLFPGGPLMRGVDIVPHYSFAEYDKVIGNNPDLIVIPFLPYEQAPEYQTIMAWIRAHAGPRTILLSICAGAKNLADTGLLAGRSATTHHYTFPAIAEAHPDVQLVHGVRYVEDGNLISSAGVTAGVDASLFTLQRLLGREAALDVAQQIGYPHTRFLDDPTYDVPVVRFSSFSKSAPPLTNIFLGGYRTGSELGVALYPGMSEIALASVVDTYPHEGSITITTVAPECTVVLSRHGLPLVPRWSFADAPQLDRIILPGSPNSTDAAAFEDWAEQRQQPPVERIHGAGGYAYDLTFADIARRAGSVIGNEAVYLLEYPLGREPFNTPPYSFSLMIRMIFLALLGLGLAFLVDTRLGSRKQRRQAKAMQTAAA